jgi:hypothetical protein
MPISGHDVASISSICQILLPEEKVLCLRILNQQTLTITLQ